VVLTAFETAWDSVQKEYTLDWRDRAKDLRPITDFSQLGDPIGSGVDSKVYKHPFGYGNFVVKLPHFYQLSRKKQEKWDKTDPTTQERNVDFDRYFLHNRRGGTEEYENRKGLPQIMEELGFPVVSEMLLDRFDSLNTFVQPLLEPKETGVAELTGSDWRKEAERLHREQDQFDASLSYALGDLETGGNEMRDGQGRLRAMDMGMDFPDVYDGSPIDYNLDRFNEFNIDFPATKLLNQMDVHDIDRPYYKEYLEALEPHVTNSRTLRLDGLPLYLMGY